MGVSETATQRGDVNVTVKLYETADCQGVPYRLDSRTVNLSYNSIRNVEFSFVGPQTDGGTTKTDGGVDCDLELCTTPPECHTFPVACGSDGGCAFGPAASGTPCRTDWACNGAGTCIDSACLFQPAGTPCDDGLTCTTNDACTGATCEGACPVEPTPVCKRRVPSQCSMSAATECVYENVDEDQTCDTDGSRCYQGACIPWFKRPPSNLSNSVLALPYPGAGKVWHIQKTADLDDTPTVCNITLSTSGTSYSLISPDPDCAVSGEPNFLVQQQSDGSELAVFISSGLQIDSNVRLVFVGTRPAVVVVLGNASIGGRIRVGPSAYGSPAGSTPAICEATASDGAASGQGGAGGSFSATGGAGGNGGPAGQPAEVNTALTPLRAGCRGGHGGGHANSGGVGGGAIQISVAGTLQVSGSIAAYGGGGQGGIASANGGGGGGSGGAVLIEANSFLVQSGASITVNGGGGGQGGKDSNVGDDGNDARPHDDFPAFGGAFPSSGGFGGSGGTNLPPTSGTTSSSGAGGGGGGSSGRIRINTPMCTKDGSVYVSGPATYGAQSCN